MESPSNTHRKLAAIMFTDIVDYSRITDKDDPEIKKLEKGK